MEEVLERFSKMNVLVIGDIMLDRYLIGDVERISYEAPVPIVKLERQKSWNVPGGAGNVAINLSLLAVNNVYLFGRVGPDVSGKTLLAKFNVMPNVNVQFVRSDPGTLTTLKTRLVAKHQQIVRFDLEDTSPLIPQAEDKVIWALETIVPTTQGVIISDYNKGFLTYRLLKYLSSACTHHKIPVFIDPSPTTPYPTFSNATILPNIVEAKEMSGLGPVDKSSIEKVGKVLMDKFGAVLITLGADGMILFQGENVIKVPPVSVEDVVDTVGAGDTVVSVFSLAKICGANLEKAATIASIAASIAIKRVGTYAVSFKELYEEVHNFSRSGG